jgi:Tfp pilus assembly protein PilF
MALPRYLIAAAFAASSIPALAGVVVVGGNSARLCYQAAESSLRPAQRTLEHCDDAIFDATTIRYDLVASFVNRGIIRYRRGQAAAALADFDRALALDPNQPEACLNKGMVLLQHDDARAALPLFTVALEHNTRRPELAHYARAVANEVLGNVAAAYRDYRSASEIDPDWAAPRTELQRFQVTPR